MPSCSAEGPALSALTHAGQPTTPLPWLYSGARFTCAAFVSFHCVDAPAGAALLVLWALSCTGKGSLTTQATHRGRLRIGCACSRSFGSACTARESWVQRTSRRQTDSSEGESSLPLDPTLPRQKNVR
jgi:hypothetical protein